MCLFQIHNRDNQNNNNNVDQTVDAVPSTVRTQGGNATNEEQLQFLLISKKIKNLKNGYGPLMFLVAGLQQQDQYA